MMATPMKIENVVRLRITSQEVFTRGLQDFASAPDFDF